MNNQPQPGDVWGVPTNPHEWRMVVPHSIETCDSVAYVFFGDGRRYEDSLSQWNRWQSGAKLVERKEPTQ